MRVCVPSKHKEKRCHEVCRFPSPFPITPEPGPNLQKVHVQILVHLVFRHKRCEYGDG